jgi:hypothetical protein
MIAGRSHLRNRCREAYRIGIVHPLRPVADMSENGPNPYYWPLVSDCKKAITLALLSADVSPP